MDGKKDLKSCKVSMPSIRQALDSLSGIVNIMTYQREDAERVTHEGTRRGIKPSELAVCCHDPQKSRYQQAWTPVAETKRWR
jgi:hypothetical protein